MAHEGMCANDRRIGNKPGGHEFAAQPPHIKDKQNVILGLGQALSCLQSQHKT